MWLHRQLNFILMNLCFGREGWLFVYQEGKTAFTTLRLPLNVVSYQNEGLHSASHFTELEKTKLFSDCLHPAYVTCRWRLCNLWLSPGKFPCLWVRCLANALAQWAWRWDCSQRHYLGSRAQFKVSLWSFLLLEACWSSWSGHCQVALLCCIN